MAAPMLLARLVMQRAQPVTVGRRPQ